MDRTGADPGGAVPALEAWLRPPLIPWQALRQLQETQREIEELRRGGTQTGSCPEERASHWSQMVPEGGGVVLLEIPGPTNSLITGALFATQSCGGVRRASSRRCSESCRRLNGHAGCHAYLGHRLASLPICM